MDHRSDICHQSTEISVVQNIEFPITNGNRTPTPSFLFGFPLANWKHSQLRTLAAPSLPAFAIPFALPGRPTHATPLRLIGPGRWHRWTSSAFFFPDRFGLQLILASPVTIPLGKQKQTKRTSRLKRSSSGYGLEVRTELRWPAWTCHIQRVGESNDANWMRGLWELELFVLSADPKEAVWNSSPIQPTLYRSAVGGFKMIQQNHFISHVAHIGTFDLSRIGGMHIITVNNQQNVINQVNDGFHCGNCSIPKHQNIHPIYSSLNNARLRIIEAWKRRIENRLWLIRFTASQNVCKNDFFQENFPANEQEKVTKMGCRWT